MGREARPLPPGPEAPPLPSGPGISPEARTRRRRLALRAAGGGVAWSLGLLATGLLVPLYDGQTSADANGLTLSSATYVQRTGAWVLIPLALPLLASVVAAVAVTRPDRRLRRAAGAAVLATAGLGLVLVTSGGVLLLPVAILLTAALRLTPRRAETPRQSETPGQAETPRGAETPGRR